MAKNKGLLFDDNLDLHINVKRDVSGLITSGLSIGDVTKQNQQTIILAEKGEIKEVPMLGVGITSYLDDDSSSDLLREVRTNLREDGQKVKSCGFNSSGSLVIVGGYES